LERPSVPSLFACDGGRSELSCYDGEIKTF